MSTPDCQAGNTGSQGLPQFPESLWRGTTELPAFPRLAEDHVTDVAIVGAGITGITAAYLLTKEGYKVTLLEAGEVLGGTTGFTSAKITAQHGMIYADLVKNFGEEQAWAYYQSNSEAMKWIIHTAGELGLSCDMHPEDAYLYAKHNTGRNEFTQIPYTQSGCLCPGRHTGNLDGCDIRQIGNSAVQLITETKMRGIRIIVHAERHGQIACHLFIQMINLLIR